MADEAELLVLYIRASFKVMETEIPTKKDGTVNINEALAMCAHWAFVGSIATFGVWCETMNPQPAFPWPSGTLYPG